MRAERLDDIDFAQVAKIGDGLLDQLRMLREQDPIFWSENHKSWVVTGHKQVVEGFGGSLPLSVTGRLRRIFQVLPEADRDQIPNVLETVPRMLISLDPPEQMRLRKLMIKAFSRKAAESHRDFARNLIAETLDRAADQGEIEFVEGVARKIPGMVILRMMGLPASYFPKLQYWSTALNSGLGGGGLSLTAFRSADAAIAEMNDVFRAEIADRKATPRDDFISHLLEAGEDGDKLTDDEIIATCQLTLTAGNDTTTNTIAMGVAALARHPEARRYIRDNPDAIQNVVMEIMRFVAMSTAQVRVASSDFDWGGHPIKSGDHVYLMIAGANRDPSEFAEPDRLDFARAQQGNTTFGPGMHHCIGHYLAKMQLQEFFPAFADRFDRVEILDGSLDWGTALGFRGLRSLNVRLGRHPASNGDRAPN